MRNKETIVPAVVIFFLMAGIFVASRFIRPVTKDTRPHMVCALSLGRLADSSRILIAGYNYFLLQKYASDNGKSIEILLEDYTESYTDSLKQGKLDIAVIPFSGVRETDSLLVSIPLDSVCIWVTNHTDKAWMAELNEWINSWHNSPEYPQTRERFFDVLNPHSRKTRSFLSPYDDIIKTNADSIGWDWRMMAAVIYHESRFHIEAKSRRGARGLMQMMPRTSRKFGVTHPLDPEDNIKAGAAYLGYLSHRFRHIGFNTEERYKYVLAAYNAGEGRMDDVLKLARYKGVDTDFWDNITAEVIPEMRDSLFLEKNAPSFGLFKGAETIRYVDTIFDLYNSFCEIIE